MIYLQTKDIPIQNIYYMLMYSWDRAKEIESIDINNIEGNNLYDLLSLVLTKSISKIIKKGTYKEYKSCYEETSSLRGKINFDDSLKRNSFRNGKAFCEFDEFSDDVIHNQILKYTMYNILKSKEISKVIKDDIMKVYHYFNGVSLVRVNKVDFNNLKLHKNNLHYKLSLDICNLIYNNMMPDESDGRITFKQFYREDREMAYIFENFVRNFYNRHLENCRVVRENISWDAQGDNLGFLPIMQTDITIKEKSRVTIMDTKYYRNSLSRNMEREKFHSNNLYQIFSYLKNAESKGEIYNSSRGILLYPQVDRYLDEDYDVQGHKIKVCTLNLNEEWESIHNRLLEIYNS